MATEYNLPTPRDSLKELPIEILIGDDSYWKIVNNKAPIPSADPLLIRLGT
jgi:hypothetical protein